ncbi:MAG: aldehyde ferredoxin oxidoreductase family protein [Desulfobacterales bacterium]|nr:aldehyde ferredoxin oxidoreductase family protein [Desulfobacterales bacterium]MBF0397140.1 aldehyde ferredoxin oxidoreductase family protein [Desulfobacterales bacterium]
MASGFMGKILWADLSNKEISEEQISDEVYRNYLSGIGLGAYILNDRIPKGADPLGKDNILGIMSGLLTGTGSLFTGRWMAVGKSPLTGGWGDANCGGNFSPAIKRCGYDGIFFKGISDEPVYLYIGNEKPEIKSASRLWGKDAVETEEILKDIHGPKARVACIGTSGENLSLISGICNDRGRIAARSGLGALMGSKKLKAVVLNGNKKIMVHDKKAVRRLSIKCNLLVRMQPPFIPGDYTSYLGIVLRTLPLQMAQDGMLYKILLKKWGTVSMNQASIEMGDAPVKNWLGTHEDFGTEKSIKINPDVFISREKEKYYCYSCPLGCGGICSLPGKEFHETHKPEYETVIALSALCMNEDIGSIFYLNEVLNRAGMDSISAGATVAFAIECYMRGILTKEDTDGIDLSWGNSKAIIELVHKMVKREGIGNILADGVKIAAQKIGKGAENCAVHAGGQELPMHDSRNDPGFALHYSVESTPGRHTIGSQLYYEMFQLWNRVKGAPKVSMFFSKDTKYIPDEKKAQMAAYSSKFMNIANASGLCLFGAFLGVGRLPIFEWLNMATGFKKNPEEYIEIGAKIQNLKQSFNIKHGIDPRDYKVCERALGRPPLATGPNKDRTIDIEKMMSLYWQQFEWNKDTGKPVL